MRVVAIVLAGGRAVRFGGAKLEATLDGAPLLEHALRIVAALADDVVVAGSTPATNLGAHGGPIRQLADAEPFGGPLSALAGALVAIDADLALVVGGDMPGLQPDVLRSMLGRLAADDATDAVILEAPAADADTPPQVLPLAIRVATARRAATDAIVSGNRSLQRLLDRLRVETIPATEWLQLDPSGRTLVDVDRPEDLERLR